MWSEFDDEMHQPILVDGKAVVTVWINQFTDTDCGGGYLEVQTLIACCCTSDSALCNRPGRLVQHIRHQEIATPTEVRPES